MEWLTETWLRIKALVRRRQLDRDLDAELRFHQEMRAAALREDGMDADEAHYASRRRFGNATALREACRSLWTFAWLETVAQDVRFGARMLARKPGFTLAAVVTLALGIGANTTIFGVVDAVLLTPPPFKDPDRLALLLERNADDRSDFNLVSAPNFEDWQRRASGSFDGMALFDAGGKGYNISGDAEPERANGARVTWNFFDVLGAQPALGRTFEPRDEQFGDGRVVVVSDGLWRSRYGADPALVGRPITVDGDAYTVVGVMPPGFDFTFWSGTRKLYFPMTYTENDHGRGSHSFVAVGRLKPGVTLEQADAGLDTVGRGLAQEYPGVNAGQSATAVAMGAFGQEQHRTVWLALLAVAGFVLLIACVNVANLVMARGTDREWEFALRSALGASRWRCVRQLLTESLLIAFAGGLAGTLVSIWSGSLVAGLIPGDLRYVPFRQFDGVSVDARVLGFAWAVTAVTGVLFGLAPALVISRHGMGESLKEGSRGSSRGPGHGLRQTLVVAEVALALVVLTGAGLMLESMKRVLDVDPGLDATNVLVLGISLPQKELYTGPPDDASFVPALRERVGSIPGVVSVSAVGHLPLGGGRAGRSFGIEGQPDPGSENRPHSAYSVACPDYFKTMGIPLVAGREFTERDSVDAPGVIVVNEALARKYWPGEDPVGRRIKMGGLDSDDPWLTVVGVAKDTRQFGLDQDASPIFFRPYSQAAWPTMSIVVRTAAAPASFAESVKKALAEIEPNRPVSSFVTMEDVLHDSVGSRRFPTYLLLAFSVLALALAAVGIWGVVAFGVTQRTREIGIRVALGAQGRDVLGMILRRSLGAALLGIALGLVGAFVLTRFLASMLFEVQPMDPRVLVTVSVVLAAVAVVASYLPARRAMKIDPITALRCD